MTVHRLTAADLARTPLPQPVEGDDKEARGAVLVVAGGAAVPGAPLLTGLAALRVGAGKLALAASREHAVVLGVAMPEAMIIPVPVSAAGEIQARASRPLGGQLDACGSLVIGPGMMEGDQARALCVALLNKAPDLPVVVDAAALPHTADAKAFAATSRGRTVLTPHAGEMATMLSRSKQEIQKDPLGAAVVAASRFNAVVVMKGSTTYVVTPQGEAWRHDGGVTGLGTSGSGDVLAGVIGGLMARGASPLDAARWGVHLHAEAGARLARKIGPFGFLASDLLAALPRVLVKVSAPSRKP